MFCKNCGTQLKEGANFCGNCGKNVVKSTVGIPVSINDSADVGPYSMQEIAAKYHNTQQNPSNAVLPPTGKKLSLFQNLLIVIPIQYICCFTFVAFYYYYDYGGSMAVFEDYFYSPGSSLMYWDRIPMSQRALFDITLFLVIHGPSSVLLFFIIKHCLKRRKKAAFGFSIPLALYYIALIGFSLLGLDIGGYFCSSYHIFYALYYTYDYVPTLFEFLVFGIITFYPFIPPLLTLIRFEGSRPQPASAKISPVPVIDAVLVWIFMAAAILFFLFCLW